MLAGTYCGWTKSISQQLETMLETIVCWYSPHNLGAITYFSRNIEGPGHEQKQTNPHGVWLKRCPPWYLQGNHPPSFTTSWFLWCRSSSFSEVCAWKGLFRLLVFGVYTAIQVALVAYKDPYYTSFFSGLVRNQLCVGLFRAINGRPPRNKTWVGIICLRSMYFPDG